MNYLLEVVTKAQTWRGHLQDTLSQVDAEIQAPGPALRAQVPAVMEALEALRVAVATAAAACSTVEMATRNPNPGASANAQAVK